MAKGVNVVILLGNVGNDPEYRTIPNSSDGVVNLSLATSESWKDKTTGEKKERTEWHRITAYGRLAEIIRDYVRKGSKIYVQGSLHTKKWKNKDGVDQYSTEIKVSEMQMLDSQKSQGGGTEYPRTESHQQASGERSYNADGTQPQQPETFDDDIPF